jgi:hypothetical protein
MQKVGVKGGEDSCGPGQLSVVGAIDHCIVSSGSIKGWVLLDELSYYERVKKMLIKL